MAKTLKGKVVSMHMQGTIIVEVVTKKPHPMYKKLMTRSKKFKVALGGQSVSLGDIIMIQETKPVSKGKHFVVTDKKGETEIKV